MLRAHVFGVCVAQLGWEFETLGSSTAFCRTYIVSNVSKFESFISESCFNRIQ